jgi:hypothetical protein
MAKEKILKFKQGDDFKLDFTLTDTNNSGAVTAAAAVQTKRDEIIEMEDAVSPDLAAIAVANDELLTLIDAYEAAILMDITGWGIASQLRWYGELIDTFSIDETTLNIGKFAIIATETQTSLWVPRKYEMDIQFTRVTGKISSETFILDVEKDVTNV